MRGGVRVGRSDDVGLVVSEMMVSLADGSGPKTWHWHGQRLAVKFVLHSTGWGISVIGVGFWVVL